MANKKIGGGKVFVGRDRPVPRKVHRKAVSTLAPDSPIGLSPDFEKTMDEVARTDELPDAATLEARFPGITMSSHARREFMMLAIFNLRLRGKRRSVIAKALGVTEQTVYGYVKHMEKAFERDIAGISFTGQVGRSIATYRELQAKAAELFEKSKSPANKLRAIREMATLEKNIIGALKDGGFFNNARLNPAHSNSAPASQVSTMQDIILGMFGGRTEEDEAADILPDDPEQYVIKDDDFTFMR